MTNLVCFGLGYSARMFGRRRLRDGWQVLGTTRSAERAAALREEGLEAMLFSGEAPSADLSERLRGATHLLLSIAPGSTGDPALIHHRDDIANAPDLEWIGYLSTVGVYGDHDGAWVDEETPVKPTSERSVRRVAAEKAWREFGAETGKCVQLFRIAGIYGPGRGPLENVRLGKSKRIVKPGQVFNRIHVEDIASILDASIASPRAGAIYNVSDNEPAPPQEVVAYAAELLGVPPPPEIAFEDADLTPMGRSFYGENKRVSNARIRNELGVALSFPTYREGIAHEVAALSGEPSQI
ncbi:MAG: SDR family oxidoreductase [Hyphomicrobiaceae bacterium]|nr:SDR family oxidoreductase [Hyphomicrobiaceae bacterium]